MTSASPIEPALPAPGRPKRLYWLLTIGMFLILGVLGAVYFWFSRPVGSGPAGPLVRSDAFREVWTQRPVLLVGLGDSITDGFGARPGHGYFDLLVTNAPDDAPDMLGRSLSAVIPLLRATNLAVSGSVSLELAEAQLPQLPPADTNTLALVVITTGGNDLIHNYGRTPPRALAMYGATWDQAQPWIADYERRLHSIATNLNGRFPGGCEIFIANIYDPTDGVGDIQHAGLPAWPDGARVLAAYNNVIQRIAESYSNVHLVDIHALFLGHGIHCTQFWNRHYRADDPHYWYYTNLEDPNERGYDAIRRLFLLEMAKVLKNV